MASGTPVVGASAGGVRDNIRHGETGLLCEPGHVPAFVEAVEKLVQQSELRQTLAGQGRAYALEQSWGQIWNRLFKSYLQVSAEMQNSKDEPPARISQ
ncbi:D-inositol-3-phosphate glycosyltransferase [compost metagenome]